MSDLETMVKDDLKFTLDDADTKLIQIPLLRIKYANLLMKRTKVLNDYEQRRKEVWGEKWRYYATDYKQIIDRRDIPSYIECDADYVEVRKKVNRSQESVDFVDNVLKSIDNMNWLITSAIKWHMFKNGG